MEKARSKEGGRVRVQYDVPHHIREWRIYRNLSVNALGKAAGMSGSAVSQLERGVTSYTEVTLTKLAAVLHCKTWQLLAGSPNEPAGLWEQVLEATAPDIDISGLSSEGQEVLREVIVDHCMMMKRQVEHLHHMQARSEAQAVPADDQAT